MKKNGKAKGLFAENVGMKLLSGKYSSFQPVVFNGEWNLFYSKYDPGYPYRG